MKIISRLLVSLIALSAISSNAALYDRGNGMIYDSTLNITWLQDSNYAKTSGYHADGLMTWQQATDWAANLTYGGYSDWRLPSAGLIGNNDFSYNGSTDNGPNNTRSEIGHLFFELGNKASHSSTGDYQPDYGVTDVTFVDAGTNQNVSFLNLQNSVYWQAETNPVQSDGTWLFDTNFGALGWDIEGGNGYAWAVRAGDVVPAVPLPAAGWMLGSALVGLAGMKRRRG